MSLSTSSIDTVDTLVQPMSGMSCTTNSKTRGNGLNILAALPISRSGAPTFLSMALEPNNNSRYEVAKYWRLVELAEQESYRASRRHYNREVFD